MKVGLSEDTGYVPSGSYAGMIIRFIFLKNQLPGFNVQEKDIKSFVEKYDIETREQGLFHEEVLLSGSFKRRLCEHCGYFIVFRGQGGGRLRGVFICVTEDLGL